MASLVVSHPVTLPRRLFLVLPVLFVVATLVFFLIHLVPGDPVDLILGEAAPMSDRLALRHDLRLDLPMAEQYVLFLRGVVTGDWGVSLFDRVSVLGHIGERYLPTVVLSVAALFVALAMALPLGLFSALRKYSLYDSASMFFALLGISMPNFWLGPLLILLFSIHWGWLPVSGMDSLSSLVLPALTMGTALAAILARMIRSSMLDVLQADYIRTARAKGLDEKRVILKHALRNALNPVITIVGLQIGALLAGAVVTEKIFAWPGLGSLLLESIQRRDYPLVQGCVLVIAGGYVLVNALTDLLYRVADPRVRLR